MKINKVLVSIVAAVAFVLMSSVALAQRSIRIRLTHPSGPYVVHVWNQDGRMMTLPDGRMTEEDAERCSMDRGLLRFSIIQSEPAEIRTVRFTAVTGQATMMGFRPTLVHRGDRNPDPVVDRPGNDDSDPITYFGIMIIHLFSAIILWGCYRWVLIGLLTQHGPSRSTALERENDSLRAYIADLENSFPTGTGAYRSKPSDPD